MENGEAAPRQAPDARIGEKKKIRRRMLGCLIVVGVLAVLLFYPFMESAQKRGQRKTDCCVNLKQIYSAIDGYKKRHGSYPSGTGATFLENLRWGVPDLMPDEIFVCPVRRKSGPANGFSDYRGPSEPVTDSLPPNTPIAGDLPAITAKMMISWCSFSTVMLKLRQSARPYATMRRSA